MTDELLSNRQWEMIDTTEKLDWIDSDTRAGNRPSVFLVLTLTAAVRELRQQLAASDAEKRRAVWDEAIAFAAEPAHA